MVPTGWALGQVGAGGKGEDLKGFLKRISKKRKKDNRKLLEAQDQTQVPSREARNVPLLANHLPRPWFWKLFTVKFNSILLGFRLLWGKKRLVIEGSNFTFRSEHY